MSDPPRAESPPRKDFHSPDAPVNYPTNKSFDRPCPCRIATERPLLLRIWAPALVAPGRGRQVITLPGATGQARNFYSRKVSPFLCLSFPSCAGQDCFFLRGAVWVRSVSVSNVLSFSWLIRRVFRCKTRSAYRVTDLMGLTGTSVDGLPEGSLFSALPKLFVIFWKWYPLCSVLFPQMWPS